MDRGCTTCHGYNAPQGGVALDGCYFNVDLDADGVNDIRDYVDADRAPNPDGIDDYEQFGYDPTYPQDCVHYQLTYEYVNDDPYEQYQNGYQDNGYRVNVDNSLESMLVWNPVCGPRNPIYDDDNTVSGYYVGNGCSDRYWANPLYDANDAATGPPYYGERHPVLVMAANAVDYDYNGHDGDADAYLLARWIYLGAYNDDAAAPGANRHEQ